jgi:hypothetical protein
MSAPRQNVRLLQDLLDLKFPQSYSNFLEEHETISRNLPIPLPGSSVSLDEDSVWGGTEFLRAARTDLERRYLALLLLDAWAICLDLTKEMEGDSPVVKVELTKETPPEKISSSFVDFLEKLRTDPDGLLAFAAVTEHPVGDYWFQCGLERLGRHMENLSFAYDHKEGGQLPRSHVWRPYRFCVQDVILGVSVIRHDRKFNRLEVDVLLTSSIPDYPADSGCRALCLILLSDAYRSGSSMEILFTKHVEGGRVPREIVSLAKSLGTELTHVKDGGISPHEAKQLYLALSGFSDTTRVAITTLEEEGRVSSAGICYGMHHGVWSIPELEVILFGSSFPDTILRGLFSPESWHLFQYDLFHARNALMGGYLDLRLARREYTRKSGGIVELEDDEQGLEILFNAEYYSKVYCLDEIEGIVTVPWLYGMDSDLTLSGSHRLWTLLRARDTEDMQANLLNDLQQAITLKKNLAAANDNICVMVPADFKRLDCDERTKIIEDFRKERIGLLLCPDFLTQLDQEVSRRFEAIKVIRQ